MTRFLEFLTSGDKPDRSRAQMLSADLYNNAFFDRQKLSNFASPALVLQPTLQTCLSFNDRLYPNVIDYTVM